MNSNRDEPSDLVPLSRAAQLLRISRERAFRRVATGELDGEQAPDGRWFVRRASIERALRGSVAGPPR